METKFQTEKVKKEKEIAEQNATINKLEGDKQRSRFWIAVSIA